MKQSLLLLIILFLVSCGSPSSSGSGAESLETGHAVFESRCEMCHGADGTAGLSGATNLQTSRLDSASVQDVIRNGRKAMPPFKDILSKEEMTAVRKYLFTLRQ